jgi:DNA polymerase (family X)
MQPEMQVAGTPPSNEAVADALERIGILLEAQGENGYRARAYRTAAATIRALEQPVAFLAQSGGTQELEKLCGVGRSIAAVIREFVDTGRLALLERLEGRVSPEDLFRAIPGIGEELAARIHTKLGIETLEQLELAAHTGRLETLPGFGRGRAETVRSVLGKTLGTAARRHAPSTCARQTGYGLRPQPSLPLLLSVDAEYRKKARSGALRTLAPKRFNPTAEAWLPILHTTRDGWVITALYSNSWRAHQLGKTYDWVVLFCEHDGHEAQFTVVTETRGALAGNRVVRGHEAECLAHRRAPAAARPRSESAAQAS